MSENTAEVETAESRPGPSKKMQIASVVAATAVTVVLSAAASYAIDKIGNKVKNLMAPEPEDED